MSRIPNEQRVDLTPEVVERFWSRVGVWHPLGCWLWNGYRSSDRGAYGVLQLRTRGARTTAEGVCEVRAHRLAYHLLRGPIPDGLHLDHLCRNPPCVNPDHLEPVTLEENNRRGYGIAQLGKRDRRDSCHRGHPFDDLNTRETLRGGYVLRQCRACQREWARSRRPRPAPKTYWVNPHPLAPHGELRCYMKWDCRCGPCRKAKADYDRAWSARRAEAAAS